MKFMSCIKLPSHTNRFTWFLTIVIIYSMSSSYKPMLLSGKNKMVTSGYETKFRGETACVIYFISSIFFVVEPYQHS